jgi:hypothetical protein
MNIKLLATLISTLTLTGVFSASAQAFTFKTNYSTTDTKTWKKDIYLNSVEFGGKTYTNFSLVNRVNLLQNDTWTGGNTGAASGDRGDLATVGIKEEKLSNEGAATALGNRYLSSIIDTEDTGKFTMDLFFNKPVDNILVWERGQNSNLQIQALDAKGNVISNWLTLGISNPLKKTGWTNAGYRLDTTEITGSQAVASKGVSLLDLGLNTPFISGLRVRSFSSYAGPDFKIMGTVAASIPEPATVFGLGVVGAALILSRRQKAN